MSLMALSAAEKKSAPELESVRFVISDSMAALTHAYSIGLPRDARVLTSSPAVALSNKLSAEALEDRVDDHAMAALKTDAIELMDALHKAVQTEFEDPLLALVAARIVPNMTNAVLKAMALKENELEGPIATLEVASDHAAIDGVVNAPWRDLLGEMALTIACPVTAEIQTLDQFAARPADLSLWRRVTTAPAALIGTSLMKYFWRRFALPAPRGDVLLARENALSRETALALGLRGFALRSINLGTPPHQSDEFSGLSRLEEVTMTYIRNFLRSRVLPGLVDNVANLMGRQLAKHVGAYSAGRALSRDTLDEVGKSAKALFTNVPSRPEQVGLYAACRDRGLPVISFQHGVAKEIDSNHDLFDCHGESTASDIFVAFNPRGAAIAESLPYAQGCSITAGMPREYWSTKQRHTSPFPPICYASTQLYCGNINPVALRGATDHEMARTEISLIESVFAQLPHRVLYKPYPTRRLLDADPVLECAKSVPMIDVHEDQIELQHLLGEFRLVVTSRATSTMSWCLASGVPLVFIDMPWPQQRLHDDVRVAMSEAAFLVDAENPDYLEDLHNLLSRPLDEIDSEWNAKAHARQALLESHFGSSGRGAGRRAARQLIKHLSNGQWARS